jgi:predicted PurR-regulated permease PerM
MFIPEVLGKIGGDRPLSRKKRAIVAWLYAMGLGSCLASLSGALLVLLYGGEEAGRVFLVFVFLSLIIGPAVGSLWYSNKVHEFLRAHGISFMAQSLSNVTIPVSLLFAGLLLGVVGVVFGVMGLCHG